MWIKKKEQSFFLNHLRYFFSSWICIIQRSYKIRRNQRELQQNLFQLLTFLILFPFKTIILFNHKIIQSSFFSFVITNEKQRSSLKSRRKKIVNYSKNLIQLGGEHFTGFYKWIKRNVLIRSSCNDLLTKLTSFFFPYSKLTKVNFPLDLRNLAFFFIIFFFLYIYMYIYIIPNYF